MYPVKNAILQRRCKHFHQHITSARIINVSALRPIHIKTTLLIIRSADSKIQYGKLVFFHVVIFVIFRLKIWNMVIGT